MSLIAQREAMRLLLRKNDETNIKLKHRLRAARRGFLGGLLLRFKAWLGEKPIATPWK